MADEVKISELFSVLVEWALASGAERIDQMSSPWTGEAGDWSVLIHGQPAELDGVPPFTFKLTHKTAFLGMAIVGITGGAVVGPTEQELIEHFRAAILELANA